VRASVRVRAEHATRETKTPKWAVISTEDHAVPTAAQKFEARRMGAHITYTRSGHDVAAISPAAVNRAVAAATNSVHRPIDRRGTSAAVNCVGTLICCRRLLWSTILSSNSGKWNSRRTENQQVNEPSEPQPQAGLTPEEARSRAQHPATPKDAAWPPACRHIPQTHLGMGTHPVRQLRRPLKAREGHAFLKLNWTTNKPQVTDLGFHGAGDENRTRALSLEATALGRSHSG